MPQSVPSSIGSDSWTTAAWLDSVGATAAIAQVLLRRGAECDDELQDMRKLAELQPDELAERLRAGGLVDRLAGALRPKLQELKDGPTVAEMREKHKFLQEGGLQKYEYADLSAFFGGLEAQIGPPEAHVLSAMERDHTAAADSLVPFTTPDYGVTTSPQMEWWFVVESERDLQWPTEKRLVGSDDQRRRPMSLRKLDTELAKMNAELRKLGEPLLIREEGIGARKYTGPMFVKYNETLRSVDREGRRGYVATIHAINSMIIKASKLTKAARVYRGFSGGVLPESFWTPNKQGARGGVERAFVSTSQKRSEAMRYATTDDRAPMLFEIQMGMTDRGCEVSAISQYPREEEFLFAPLTGFELLHTRVEGSVHVVEVRLSVKLNALTLEHVIEKLKRSQLDLVDVIRDDLAQRGVQDAALARLKSVLAQLRAREASWFNDADKAGGIERSFLSFSYDRKAALCYAADEEKPSILFEIQMGTVDRGCNLEWISQYGHERECLFPPIMGMELLHTRVEGRVLIAEVRPSVNLCTLTLQQVIKKMKQSHLTLVQLFLGVFTHNHVPEDVRAPLLQLKQQQEARDGEWFINSINFQAATAEGFATRDAVFDALSSRVTWSGAVHAATMCAREGRQDSAIAVLKRADLGLDERDDDCRLARRMVKEQLAYPWPATFAALEKPELAGLLTDELIERDRLRPGDSVLAYKQDAYTWRNAVFSLVHYGGKVVDVKVGGWEEIEDLPRTEALVMDFGGGGALVRAASGTGRAALVERLIAKGVSVFVADKKTNTPLHLAALGGHTDVCRALRAGADQGARNAQLQSAQALAQTNAVRIFTPMISDQAFAAQGSQGFTMLMRACRNKGLSWVEERVQAGEDANARIESGGFAASHLAAEEGDDYIVEMLLKHEAGSDIPNTGERTPLMYTCGFGYELCRALIEAGANNHADNDGQMALMLASSNGHELCAPIELACAHCDPDILKSIAGKLGDEVPERHPQECILRWMTHTCGAADLFKWMREEQIITAVSQPQKCFHQAMNYAFKGCDVPLALKIFACDAGNDMPRNATGGGLKGVEALGQNNLLQLHDVAWHSPSWTPRELVDPISDPWVGDIKRKMRRQLDSKAISDLEEQRLQECLTRLARVAVRDPEGPRLDLAHASELDVDAQAVGLHPGLPAETSEHGQDEQVASVEPPAMSLLAEAEARSRVSTTSAVCWPGHARQLIDDHSDPETIREPKNSLGHKMVARHGSARVSGAGRSDQAGAGDVDGTSAPDGCHLGEAAERRSWDKLRGSEIASKASGIPGYGCGLIGRNGSGLSRGKVHAAGLDANGAKAVLEKSLPRCNQALHVVVRFPRTFTVAGFRATDDVEVLQDAIERELGVPPADTWMFHRGRRLERGRTLSSYDVSPGVMVRFAVRERGGGGCSSAFPNQPTPLGKDMHELSHDMYTIRDQEPALSGKCLSSADARWDAAGFDDWASDHAIWVRVKVLRDLNAGSRCIRTAADLWPQDDYVAGPSRHQILQLYAVCDFSVMLTECPTDMALGTAADPRQPALVALVKLLHDAPEDALVYWHLLALLVRPLASDMPGRLRTPADLHRIFTFYRIRTVVVPYVPNDALDPPSIFQQGRIVAYLTFAQFCQRLTMLPVGVETLSEFMQGQKKAMEKGLSPKNFFDVPTLLKQCHFGRWEHDGDEYTAVGDMLARVLLAIRPVATDVEGFSIFCEEVQLAWVKVSFIRRQKDIVGPFPRRQDLADSDLVIGRPPRGPRLFCLSHQWDSEYHPNPSGDKMKRLAKILEALDAEDDDLLFIDFCSLPQCARNVPDVYYKVNRLVIELQAGRSSDETDRFRFGLWEMSRLYAFRECHVIVLPQSSHDFPGGEKVWGRVNNDRYWERGWCAAEYSIARVNGRICNGTDPAVREVERSRMWPDTPYEYVRMMEPHGPCPPRFTNAGDRSAVEYNFFKSCFGLTHSFFPESTYDDLPDLPSPPSLIEGPVAQREMLSKMYAYVAFGAFVQPSLHDICDGLLGRNNLASRSDEWRARQQWPLMLAGADAGHLTETLTSGHAHCLVLFTTGWDGLLDEVEALLPTLAHPPHAILLCMRFGARAAAERLSCAATVVWIRTDKTSHRNVFFGMIGPILHALHSRAREERELTDLTLRMGRAIFGARWDGAGCLRHSSRPLEWPLPDGEFTLHTKMPAAEPASRFEALQLNVVGKTDLLRNHEYDAIVDALQSGLPQGSEVLAVYRDDADSGPVSIQACVRIVSVAFLHELRDAVLMGRIDVHLKQWLKVEVAVDKSSFANVYEDSVLRLDELTAHQEERLDECRRDADVHLKAPAGGGKTYVALYRMLEALTAGNQKALVLFFARNRALSHLICTWMCKRLAENPMQRLAVLSRLYLLFDPVEDGVRQATLRNGQLTISVAPSKDRRFGLVVVDEAHHVYSDPRLEAAAEQYITEGITQRLLLSDVSQSDGNGVAFPSRMREIFLEEVVRNSMRIVHGVSAFQLGGTVAGRCHHNSNGPPMQSLLFKVEGDRFACYAREVRRALELVLDDFPGLCLHNRLAILVPDSDFLENVREPLRLELRTLRSRSFDIVSASDASAALLVGRRHEVYREWLVQDEVAMFDGLERLIVIGVGLDARIDESAETLHIRSLLYRAITRAHMLVLMVNELVRGGFLEYTSRLQLSDKFDAEAERGRMKKDAVDDAIQTHRERSEALKRVLERCGERAEPAVLALLLKDLDNTKPLVDASREAVDAWIQQASAIRQALGDDRAFAAVRLSVAADIRKGTDLEAAVASAKEEWNAQQRRPDIHAAIEAMGAEALPRSARLALTRRIEERMQDEPSNRRLVQELAEQWRRVSEELRAEVHRRGLPPLEKDQMLQITVARILKLWDRKHEDGDTAVGEELREWEEEQKQQVADQALREAVSELRLTPNGDALFRSDVKIEQGAFGPASAAIALVLPRWREAKARAQAALEAHEEGLRSNAALCCDVVVRMREMAESDSEAASEVFAKWQKEQAARTIVQGVWDSSHCTGMERDGKLRFQPMTDGVASSEVDQPIGAYAWEEELPHERARRIQWIKFYVGTGELEEAYELGWDGKPFQDETPNFSRRDT